MHDLLMRTIIYSVQFSPSSVIFMDFEMVLDIQCSQHITKEGCFILFITMRWRDWLIIIYYTSLSLLIWILFFQFQLCSMSVVYLRVSHIHISYGYEFLFFYEVLCLWMFLQLSVYPGTDQPADFCIWHDQPRWADTDCCAPAQLLHFDLTCYSDSVVINLIFRSIPVIAMPFMCQY